MPLKEDGSRNIDTEWDQAKTWAQMEDVLAKGKVKAIGVSNVSEILLEELSKTWKVVPAVNQVSLFAIMWSRSKTETNCRSSYTHSALSTSSKSTATPRTSFSKLTPLSDLPVCPVPDRRVVANLRLSSTL